INQSGAGAKSSVAGAQSIAASATLPIGWARNDIGSYTVAGTASYANVKNKTFVVTGTGSTIGGSSDSYNYTFTRVTGDFTLTARLSEVNLSDGSNRFGIMFREKLTPGSKMLTLNLQDPYERYTNFGRREIEGGNTSWIEGAQFTSAPCWYRLKRVGNVFTAYHSIDGVNWPIVGSATVSLSTQYYAGLAICGGSTTGSVATALFENVTTEGGGDVAAAPAGLTATPINSSRIRLSWTASPSAAAYIVKRSLSETGPYTTVSTTATSTTFDDINLDANTDYYYVVKSANIKGESLDSIQISAKTKELTLPPAPTGLKATVRNKNVTLNWTPTEEFTTSYNIKRSTISGGPYSVIDTSSLAYYEDKTVENGQLYYYRVSSNNALGESAESLQVSAKPDIGEVAYWPLDETTGLFGVDAWFSRKDTLKTLAKWTAGKVNNGVHMDGTATSYVALPAGLFQTLKDFTISMWVKLDAIDQWCRLFDFGSGTNTYMFVSPRSTDGYMRYAITNTGNSGELKILTKTTLSTGTWTHVAVTQLGTTCILYVNGMEVGRNAQMFLNPSLLGNTKSNYIGKSQWPDPMLKGTVDEFRIYSQALLPSQILMLKNIARQTISFDTISQKKVGDAEFALVASASSGLPLTFKTSNSLVASVTDSFVQIKKVGTADIIATQAGNESYAAALPVIRTVVVGPATGIETLTSEQVLLFPNPVTDFLHIQLGNLSSDAILHLYNSRGILLLTKNLLAIDNLIDVRSLDPGLYLAKICDGRNVVNSKFLKIGR
ncbi:MAG: LamG-like jellyroll fold domain-containing protein, partial [Bacteroidota bacterium]|nr:LamG-like jellyroll fold domain-containing protein [Bacteroidota bacterium]